MKNKKLFIVDPHIDDFIYKPLTYFLVKKRAFNKYRYISELISKVGSQSGFYFTNEHSSIPDRYTKFFPTWALKILIRIEVNLWLKINGLSNVGILYPNNFKGNINFFAFGYKKFKTLLDLSSKLKSSTVYIHLSHYHTFSQSKIDLSLNPNIVLCADNDISNTKYFKDRFNYQYKIRIVTFFVRSSFFNNSFNEIRFNKCCSTGSYHNIPRSKQDFGIYNSDGNSCLHPLRYDLAKFVDSNLDSMLTLYGTNVRSALQKEYLMFDLPLFYSQYNFAVIPGEGNGLIAIGSLEALASGCMVFLTKDELSGLKLTSNRVIIYDGTLIDLQMKINQAIKNNIFSRMQNDDSINQYTYEYLAANFLNSLYV